MEIAKEDSPPRLGLQENKQVTDGPTKIESNSGVSINVDDIDVDELLSRRRMRRGRFRQQKASLNKAPEFVKRLQSFEEAKAGDTVVFECQYKAFPRPSVKWYRDDEEITDNNRYRFEEAGKGELKVVIKHCRKSDEGAYKCKAENTEGVASTTGYLSVTGDIKEKPLSSQPRKSTQHAVSNPPRLRAIVEQESLELEEEKKCNALPPSPIHDFIETFQREQLTARQKSPPLPVEDFRKDSDADSRSNTNAASRDLDASPGSDPYENGREVTQEPKSAAQSTVLGKENGVCRSELQPTPEPIRQEMLLNEQLSSRSPASHERAPQTPKHFVSQVVIRTLPASAEASTSKHSVEGTKPAPQKYAAYKESEKNLEFPWLFHTGLTTFGTFVGTATGVSPLWYVMILAVISLLSFRILLSAKSHCT